MDLSIIFWSNGIESPADIVRSNIAPSDICIYMEDGSSTFC